MRGTLTFSLARRREGDIAREKQSPILAPFLSPHSKCVFLHANRACELERLYTRYTDAFQQCWFILGLCIKSVHRILDLIWWRMRYIVIKLFYFIFLNKKWAVPQHLTNWYTRPKSSCRTYMRAAVSPHSTVISRLWIARTTSARARAFLNFFSPHYFLSEAPHKRQSRLNKCLPPSQRSRVVRLLTNVSRRRVSKLPLERKDSLCWTFCKERV